MAISGEVPVREPTCIGNSVNVVGCHFCSSSPPPSPALKRAGYPLSAGREREFFSLKNSLCELS